MEPHLGKIHSLYLSALPLNTVTKPQTTPQVAGILHRFKINCKLFVNFLRPCKLFVNFVATNRSWARFGITTHRKTCLDLTSKASRSTYASLNRDLAWCGPGNDKVTRQGSSSRSCLAPFALQCRVSLSAALSSKLAVCPPGIGVKFGWGAPLLTHPASSNRVVRFSREYAELTKLRVTALIVMTAWCGSFLASRKAGTPSLSWGLLHAQLGIGLVSSGTAALNEVMERDTDGRMPRTAGRPLPAGRMRLLPATLIGSGLTLGGSLYLALFANRLTGLLTLLTAAAYLAAYTPLKRVSSLCTFVGAFPGAMPGVLGWVAVRNRLEGETLVLFAILFLWQFPHFFSIAWLYRDDYALGGVRMLPS